MIKIGFDANKVFRNSSGLGNYGRSSVELMAKYHPENEYSLFSAFDQNRVNFEIPKSVKVLQPKGFLGSIAPAVWRRCAMHRDIRRSKVDIFHGLTNELPFDIRFGGAKSVVSIHDLIFIRYPNLYNKFERVMFNFIYRNSCNNADMILAISQQTKNDLMEFWNIPQERIEVVYQGCNPTYYERATDEQKTRVKERYKLPDNYIVSVGTIDERRNLMLTLHALAEGKIDIPLVACGRWTPYVNKLKTYAISKGIIDKIHFLHDCSIEELPAIYQMATVSIYISLFEGFGIPILESLSSGTPVITSKGGVFDETGGGVAVQIGQYDLEELIVTLKKILSDENYRKDLINKGYEHTENFKDYKIADNLMALYNKMM